MFCPSFLYSTKCHFEFRNHLDREERAGCYTLIVFPPDVSRLLVFCGYFSGMQCALP